jgi:hypothetical protein
VTVASLLGDVLFGMLIYPSLAARFLGEKTSRIFAAILLPVLTLSLPGTLLVGGWLARESWPVMLAAGGLAFVLLYPALYLVFGRRDLVWLFGKFKQVTMNRL